MGFNEALGLTFLPTLLDVSALTALKGATLGNSLLPFLTGITLGGMAYGVVGSRMIASQGQAIANTNWNIMSTTANAVIGVIFWGETLTQKQLSGILLGCIGMYLINA